MNSIYRYGRPNYGLPHTVFTPANHEPDWGEWRAVSDDNERHTSYSCDCCGSAITLVDGRWYDASLGRNERDMTAEEFASMSGKPIYDYSGNVVEVLP